MFKVYENDIALTRGNTFSTDVIIIKDNEKYIPSGNDIVRFTAKHRKMKTDGTDFEDDMPVIDIIIPNDEDMVLTIEPSDTINLGFGAYHYDVSITMDEGAFTFVSGDLFLLPNSDGILK